VSPEAREAAGSRARLLTWLFVAAVVAVVAVRLNQCSRLTVNTADIVRHLLYGLVVASRGPVAAGSSLVELAPAWPPVPWAGVPYNYPPLALAFFTGVSSISATVFFAKLALTVVEAVNALLVARLTSSRWLGLLYLACPISIWWISREGQFEALQNLFALLALLALKKRPALAFAALALAIQVKLTAGALLPLLLVVAWREHRDRLPVCGLAFVAAFAPTVVAAAFYPVIHQVFAYSAPMTYNPYFWDFTRAEVFAWNPGWLIAANQLTSWGMAALLVVLAVRSESRIAYVAPLVWLAFLKLHGNVEFWYVVVFPTLVLPVAEPRARKALLLLWPLLDLRSAVQLILGPFGYIGPDLGMPSAFDPYLLPPGL
jgi:hypothetical protein